MNYAIQSSREGYTNYSATIEAFLRQFDYSDPAFEFDTIEAAIADAAMVAENTGRKVLVIKKINATNAKCKGTGWVYPDGDYCEGI